MYLTINVSEKRHQQMTLDDLFSGVVSYYHTDLHNTATRTYLIEDEAKYAKKATQMGVEVGVLYHTLHMFVESHAHLYEGDIHDHYETFYIPKKSHGYRRIDAPDTELAEALRELKHIFEETFGAKYHNTAFAYIKKRSTKDALVRHQSNESKWFAKFDLTNFFGSTTLDFTMQQLSNIFPFNLLCNFYVSDKFEYSAGYEMLKKAISLGFLDGGLPQGTPLSPLLTNVIMIPIDYHISKELHNRTDNNYVVTRYADDFLISSKHDFNYRQIEDLLCSVMQQFNAPFTLNREKTRYGSSAGSNWNLGLMLNKDNEITVGNQRKRQLKSAIHSYLMDKKNCKGMWELTDLQVLLGQINYISIIEPETVAGIIKSYEQKLGLVEGYLKKEICHDISYRTTQHPAL